MNAQGNCIYIAPMLHRDSKQSESQIQRIERRTRIRLKTSCRGRSCVCPKAISDEQVRKDAKALTIKWHSPAYNSSNIKTYNGQQLKVVNLGERGDLCVALMM